MDHKIRLLSDAGVMDAGANVYGYFGDKLARAKYPGHRT